MDVIGMISLVIFYVSGIVYSLMKTIESSNIRWIFILFLCSFLPPLGWLSIFIKFIAGEE